MCSRAGSSSSRRCGGHRRGTRQSSHRTPGRFPKSWVKPTTRTRVAITRLGMMAWRFLRTYPSPKRAPGRFDRRGSNHHTRIGIGRSGSQRPGLYQNRALQCLATLPQWAGCSGASAGTSSSRMALTVAEPADARRSVVGCSIRSIRCKKASSPSSKPSGALSIRRQGTKCVQRGRRLAST
jgi:hypothetical protein